MFRLRNDSNDSGKTTETLGRGGTPIRPTCETCAAANSGRDDGVYYTPNNASVRFVKTV